MLTVNLVAKDGTSKRCEARAVVAPSVLGEVGILPGHTTYITLLGAGDVRLDESNGQSFKTSISGGLMEVRNDQVTILVDKIA